MNAIINRIRSEQKIVLVIGTSALAASLYERGRAAHSLFQIPVTEVHFSSFQFINFTPYNSQLIA
jgi:PIF1-like helicase